MQTIFSFGLATVEFAMGSSEPLNEPMLDYADTHDS
jgi:hypothetical protein